MSEEIDKLRRLRLFVKQVRYALKPTADKAIIESCLDSCDDADAELRELIMAQENKNG